MWDESKFDSSIEYYFKTITVQLQDKTLTLSGITKAASDGIISNLSVTMNEDECSHTGDVYSVNNRDYAYVSFKLKEGYAFSASYYDVEDENTYTYTSDGDNDDYPYTPYYFTWDSETGEYSIYVADTLTDKTLTFTFRERRMIKMHVADGVSAGRAYYNYDEGYVYLSDYNWDTEPDFVNVAVPDGDFLIFAGDESDFSQVVVSTGSDGSGVIEPMDEYNSQLDMESLGNMRIYKIHEESGKKITDLYFNVRTKQIPVKIDEGISVLYNLDPENTGNSQYSVSSDCKTVMVSHSCTIALKPSFSFENGITVYRTYRSDGYSIRESVEPSEDGYYLISADNLEQIELVKNEYVEIRFEMINAYGFDQPDGNELTAGPYRVLKSAPFSFSAYATDDSVYGSPTVTATEGATIRHDWESETYTVYASKNVRITVKSIPYPFNTYFYNTDDEKLNYKIDITSKVYADEEEENCYKVCYDAPGMSFTVDAKGKDFVPLVILENEENKYIKLLPEDSVYHVDKDTTTYSFFADIEFFTPTTNISISRGDGAEKTFKVIFDKAGIDRVTLIDDNGVSVTPDSDSADNPDSDEDLNRTLMYTVEEGRDYILEVQAADRYFVGRVRRQIRNGIYESNRFAKESIEQPYTIMGDTSILITSEGQPKMTIKDAFTEKVTDPIRSTSSHSNFVLNTGSAYIMDMTAAGEPIGISLRQKKNSDGEISSDTGRIGIIPYDSDRKGSGSVDESLLASLKSAYPNIPILEVPATGRTTNYVFILSNKTKYTLSLTAFSEAGKDDVTITGLKRDRDGKCSLSIPVDQRVGKIIFRGKTQNLRPGDLKVEFSYASGASTYTDAHGNTTSKLSAEVVEYSSNQKRIYFISGDVPEKDIAMKITSGDGKIVYEENVTIEIKDRAGAFSVTPTANVKAVDDVSATIGVSGLSEIGGCYLGKQYIKVVATAKDAQRAATIPAEQVFYVPRQFPEYPEDATEEQIEKIDKTFTQNVKVKLNSEETGNGSACNFDFKVSLVQTKSNVTEEDLRGTDSNLNSAYYETLATTLSGATRDPYFEETLSLKKGTTSLYTGQKNIKAATASFSKTTSCFGVSAMDITQVSGAEKLGITIGENYEIYVSARDTTSPGKHIIEVTPVGPENMYSKPATFEVTVLQGIETIRVVPSTGLVYKGKGKLTVQAVCNENMNPAKSSKVSYEVVDDQGFPILDEDKNPIFTMKGTAVNIPAELEVGAGYKIYIKATAADYEGNPTTGISDAITIKSDAMNIASLAIFKWNANNRTYDILSGNEQVEASIVDLADCYVAAFEDAIPAGSSFSEEHLEGTAISPENYSLSSSSKGVKISKDEKNNLYHLTCTQVVSAAVIKATTLDGGKKNKSMAITAKYYVPNALCMEIADASGNLLSVSDDGKASYNSAAGNEITITVKEKNADNSVTELPGLCDHSLAVKGGKIVRTDKKNGTYIVVPKSATATVTLTDRAKKENAVTKLTLENANTITQAAPAVKAQNTLLTGTKNEQKINLKVTAPAGYSVAGKYVIMQANPEARYTKQNLYDAFENGCTTIANATPIPVTDKNLTLSFKGAQLIAGSYKLTAVFGTLEGDNFIPDTKSANVTVKVGKPKKVSAKVSVVTSYTMVKDGNTYGPAQLKVSGKNISDVVVNSIMNCNINGGPNSFRKYFILDDATGSISLRSDLTAEEIAYITSKDGAKDCKAYVKITAKTGDDGYGNPYVKSCSSQITIKFK